MGCRMSEVKSGSAGDECELLRGVFSHEVLVGCWADVAGWMCKWANDTGAPTTQAHISSIRALGDAMDAEHPCRSAATAPTGYCEHGVSIRACSSPCM